MVVEPASVSVVGYFMPIFAFLLVFIVLYALLKKTEVLGSNEPIMLFVSFILSSFFILEASIVDIVQFSSAWFSALVIGIFFILAILAFMPWKDPLNFLTKNDWFSWVVLGIVIAIFLASSAYTFNTAINWGLLRDWFATDWFGFILLIAIAGVAAAVIKTKK